jgi:hypothetical protein
MWNTVIESAAVLSVVVGALRFVARRMGIWGRLTEPNELEGVPARIRPRPTPRSGAVALEEPDEDEELAG